MILTLYIVNVDYLDMVPIVQVSRDYASIILCEYYQCISVDRLVCSVLFACARVYKRYLEFIS